MPPSHWPLPHRRNVGAGATVVEQEVRKLLNTLRASSQMLLDVIDDVLDLSKIESGMQTRAKGKDRMLSSIHTLLLNSVESGFQIAKIEQIRPLHATLFHCPMQRNTRRSFNHCPHPPIQASTSWTSSPMTSSGWCRTL
jgi:signal transduction histidine kinase